MSIKKYSILLFTSLLVISCDTNTQKNESYMVLDAVLSTILEKKDNKLKARIKKYPTNQKLKAELDDPLHINPKFSHLLASRYKYAPKDHFAKVQHDFWPLIYIPAFHDCAENFQIENLQLVKDSTYYINQVKKAPDTLDIQKIKNNRIHYYKTELETYNNIKQYEHLQEKGVDSIKLQEEKESMLIEENKHFQVSYPVFSKNGKYALIYIEGIGLGMQLWVLQKESKRWKRVCISHVGTIN